MAVSADLLLTAFAECECGCEHPDERPLTSEPAPTDEPPLTSEPAPTDDAPLTSEPPLTAEPSLPGEPDDLPGPEGWTPVAPAWTHGPAGDTA